MSIKAIIFDWDGTLVNSTENILISFQMACQKMGFEIPTKEDIVSLIGLSLPDIVKSLFAVDNFTKEAFIEIYLAFYQQNANRYEFLYSHCLEILKYLQTQNVLMAIATNKSRYTLDISMQANKIGHFFCFSICADESKPKPNPDMLVRILNKLHIDKAEALMVGDSRFDLEMAKRAEIASLAILHHKTYNNDLLQFSPIAIVNSFIKLRQLVYKINSGLIKILL